MTCPANKVLIYDNNSRVSTASPEVYSSQSNNFHSLAQSSQISNINNSQVLTAYNNNSQVYTAFPHLIRNNSQSSNFNFNNANYYNIEPPTQSSQVSNIQNVRVSSAKKCHCGSSSHTRISHSDCRLNKKKRRPQTSSTNNEISSFIDSLNIQNPTFVFSQSDITSHQSNEFLNTLNENYTDDIPVYRVLQCKCGSTEHQRTTHRDCILNKRVVNANQQTLPVAGRCQCGSDTHRRISHSDCPLNPKRPQNSQGNQIESLEDYEDFLNSTTEIENPYSSTLETA